MRAPVFPSIDDIYCTAEVKGSSNDGKPIHHPTQSSQGPVDPERKKRTQKVLDQTKVLNGDWPKIAPVTPIELKI